jgi:hypothetical protein
MIIRDFLLPFMMAFTTAELDFDVARLAVHGAHLVRKTLVLFALRTSGGIGTRRFGHGAGQI